MIAKPRYAQFCGKSIPWRYRKRFTRSGCVLALVLAIASAGACCAQQPPNEPQQPPVPATNPVSVVPAGLIAMMHGANDLLEAAQAADRLIDKLGPIISQVMLRVAQASDGLDPLGMKASMGVVLQQNQTIAEQNEVIQQLLRAENRRLQRANRRLKKRLRENQATDGPAHATDDSAHGE